MTPKEKATELVARFQNTIETPIIRGLKFNDAKQCALIAVDEIVSIKRHFLESNNEAALYEYWREVKQEIESL